MDTVAMDVESQQSVVLPSAVNDDPPTYVWRLHTVLLLLAETILISMSDNSKRKTCSLPKKNDRDLESQQSVFLSANNSEWRCIFLILGARKILISRADGTEHTSSTSLSLNGAASSSSTTPYSLIKPCATGDGDSEPTGTGNILPTSPQVSLDVNSDGADDHNGSNRKHQHANIARIVKAKDLVSLRNFGGVQGIAEVLDTDLESGIRGNEEDLCSWRQQANIRILKEDLVSLHKRRGVQGYAAEILKTDLKNEIPGNEEDLCFRKLMATTQSITQAPATSVLGTLLKSRNSSIIFLLFLSAAMSLAFGIMEEGKRTGWHEGVIIIIAIIILVLVPSIRDFWHKHLQKLSKKKETVVDVIRGGCQQHISISDVVLGDMVYLERNHQVPADGLFISGEFFKLDDGLESIDDQNPFMFFGSKVINGHAHMLVTCVDMNRAVQSPKKTQLQDQLDKVSTCTQITGLIISILILVVLFLRFKFGKDDDKSGLSEIKGKSAASKEFMEAIERIVMKPTGKIKLLTASLTMLLVGIVEGLPVVVSLAIARINKKALSHKAHVQDILACLNMGSITSICIEMTGGLTIDPVEVEVCRIGEAIVSEDSVIESKVVQFLCDGIYALQSPHCSTNDQLLSWVASMFGIEKTENFKKNCRIVEAKELNSNDKKSGVLLMRKNGEEETNMSLHWKGPATTILPMCSDYYDINGAIHAKDESKNTDLEKFIKQMQSKNLEIIAFAYRQTDVHRLEENNLILIGLLGLKHTNWEETRKAMADCRDAGVDIKLVSTEDVSVLKAIAEECKILVPNSDQMVLKGEDFRNFTYEKRMETVERIAVLGNSLPSDRLLFVQCLKQKGNRVAVVGVRATETPAMKEADVGVLMGTWRTKIAKESSDIFICDGNFSFLVTIIRHGRCGYNNIRKYIQLELTTTIAGSLISTITTVHWGDAPISAIQLAWVNLIVLVFGGLALLTEPPTDELLPLSRNHEQLITKAMWRSIIIQASYQAAILVTFLHNGQSILGIDQEVSQAMIFNTFLLCQVFNIFNVRKLDKKNVFKVVYKNPWFWVAVGVTVLLQAAFLEIASTLGGIARLNCEQWAVSSLIGMASWVIHLAEWILSNFSLWISGYI